jgi:hypothetical protein
MIERKPALEYGAPRPRNAVRWVSLVVVAILAAVVFVLLGNFLRNIMINVTFGTGVASV